MKTYAQVLGIKPNRKENKDHEKVTNEKKKKQQKEEKKIKELEKVIKIIAQQIIKLKEIITVVCNIVV